MAEVVRRATLKHQRCRRGKRDFGRYGYDPPCRYASVFGVTAGWRDPADWTGLNCSSASFWLVFSARVSWLFYQWKVDNKPESRLIHNRPGPVRCENAWYRSVTSQQCAGPETSFSIPMICSSLNLLFISFCSFYLSRTTLFNCPAFGGQATAARQYATDCPTARFITRSPTSATVPAPSIPKTIGN
jgi:hypothetical protein